MTTSGETGAGCGTTLGIDGMTLAAGGAGAIGRTCCANAAGDAASRAAASAADGRGVVRRLLVRVPILSSVIASFARA